MSRAGLELGSLVWWLRDLPLSHRSGDVGPKLNFQEYCISLNEDLMKKKKVFARIIQQKFFSD